MSISTVVDVIRVHGADGPDRPALILDDRVVTWGQLYERSKRVANALLDDHVVAQERVAFLEKNGIEHFELFFGCSLLNAICVDINWRLAPSEVAYIVNDTLAKVFVVGKDFVPVLEAIANRLEHVTKIVVIGGHEHYESYESWAARGAAVDPGAVAKGSDVAYQLYSSGTTGRPKGVMISNDNMFALLPAAREMWRLSRDSVNLVAMPLFHIGGSGWATAGMYNGCVTVVVRDLDPARLVELIVQRRITHAFLVPAVLQLMLAVPGVHEADLSSLEVILYGASPISEHVLADAIRAFRCDFWQAYGLTETTGAIVNLPPADHDPDGPSRHRLRAAGLPGPGVEIRVVDTNSGGPVAVGEVGEVWIRSPQNMLGYWNLPEETAKALVEDGWFCTGDIGYLDRDGYLYIHDRLKDMIVSGGENVYPAEVENVLMGHSAVADVAVIGVPDAKWGETPKAMVVRRAGLDIGGEELIAFCREHLARFKCPTSVDFVDALPRNPSGKILKKDLRAPFWEGRDRFVS